MMLNKNQKNNNLRTRGQVMLTLVILFMMISLIIIFGVSYPSIKNIKVANDLFRSKQSFFLADSGLVDAVYRVKNNLNIGDTTTLSLIGASIDVELTETLDEQTIVSSSSFNDYIRNVTVKLSKGVGTAFYYGVQIGNGGFDMQGSSQVNGNVYANGPIVGGIVTGSAISATTTVVGINNVVVGQSGIGDAWSKTIDNSVVAGTLKCQTGSGNGRACDSSFGIPPPLEMPISDDQILTWKAEAEAVLTIEGNHSPTAPVNLGPVKINGNLDVKKAITMTGTIWVTGELSFGGGGSITLATSTYGVNSGVIIVDKYTSFTGGSQIYSTGESNSYVMLLVTSDCPNSAFCNGKKAISAGGGAGSVLLVAPYGTISFSGNSSARGVVANKIEMGGGTIIDYEVGLADQNFISGPAGGWHVQSYKETE